MALLDKAEWRRMSRERFPLSNSQAEHLLSKHNLGDLDTQRFIGGNFTNSVFECQTISGNSYILKIQYRSGNQPLEADRDVTFLLREILPVASFCILDNDCDAIPHPTLVLSKLPGDLAESIFENSTHHARIRLCHMLGEILAAIHSAPISDGQVPNKLLFRLNGWREKVLDGLFKDEELKKVIEGIDRGFYPQLQRLLDKVPDLQFEEELRLIWGDPKFHNFNVQAEGDDIQLCGVFDFQTAGLGNPVFDRFYLDGNFKRTQADGLYLNPEYLKSCYDAYSACGMKFPQASETERALRELILNANAAKSWWDAARVLHPSVVKSFAIVLDRLEWLRTNVTCID